MKPFVLGLAIAAALAGSASAQDAPAMSLTVRPSGFDKGEEARLREERLLKKMERADYLLRNICIHCGGGINRPGAYGPVDPVATLGRSVGGRTE